MTWPVSLRVRCIVKVRCGMVLLLLLNHHVKGDDLAMTASLTKLNTLLKGPITPKKWIEITAQLDKIEEDEIELAVQRIEEASSGWPSSLDPGYYNAQLPPERLPSPDPRMEVRICPPNWNKDVFEGKDAKKFSVIRILMPRGADRIKASYLPNLLELEHLTHLRYLLLAQVKLSAKFFKAMKKPGHNLSSLTHLTLWYSDASGMSTSTLKALLDASLPNLEHLNLAQNYIGPECGTLFAKSKGFDGLRSLDLSNNSLGAQGVEALSSASFMGDLEVLHVGMNTMGDGALDTLLATLTSALKTLLLDYNGLGDEGMNALAEATHLTSLERLDISQNAATPDGLRALVHAPHLQPSLHTLKVGQGFTPEIAREMIADNLLPQLTTLHAEYGQEEADAAVALLANARAGLGG